MKLAISFRGPRRAWALLILLGLLWAVERLLAPGEPDAEARKAVRVRLVADHLRDSGLGDRPWHTLSERERRDCSDRALEADRIQLLTLDVRGFGRRVSVRARYMLDGRESVRFYALERSALFGWILHGEIPALVYHLTLW